MYNLLSYTSYLVSKRVQKLRNSKMGTGSISYQEQLATLFDSTDGRVNDFYFVKFGESQSNFGKNRTKFGKNRPKFRKKSLKGSQLYQNFEDEGAFFSL